MGPDSISFTTRRGPSRGPGQVVTGCPPAGQFVPHGWAGRASFCTWTPSACTTIGGINEHPQTGTLCVATTVIYPY